MSWPITNYHYHCAISVNIAIMTNIIANSTINITTITTITIALSHVPITAVATKWHHHHGPSYSLL